MSHKIKPQLRFIVATSVLLILLAALLAAAASCSLIKPRQYPQPNWPIAVTLPPGAVNRMSNDLGNSWSAHFDCKLGREAVVKHFSDLLAGEGFKAVSEIERSGSGALLLMRSADGKLLGGLWPGGILNDPLLSQHDTDYIFRLESK